MYNIPCTNQWSKLLLVLKISCSNSKCWAEFSGQQKSCTTWYLWNPIKHETGYHTQLVIAGFLNHQQYLMYLWNPMKNWIFSINVEWFERLQYCHGFSKKKRSYFHRVRGQTPPLSLATGKDTPQPWGHITQPWGHITQPWGQHQNRWG